MAFRRARKTSWVPTAVLAVVWAAAVYVGEWILARRALAACQWPAASEAAVRVALVADPQLVDGNTYRGRPAPLMALTRVVVDRYLARNWRLVDEVLDPDTYLFLGDLFDGGREWSNGPWQAEYARWNRVFPPPPGKRVVQSLPGNHDIGYGNDIVPAALNRFRSYFGPTSTTIELGNHTVVLLDTISMANTEDQAIWGPPFEFFDALDIANSPSVLLTHVPLHRPADAKCGRWREGDNNLPWTAGYQYNTQVTPELTDRILKKLQPTAIFSGDDHDACHVRHSYTDAAGVPRGADEYTVKSFSMAMGIHHPGLQLLVLDPVEGLKTTICLLHAPMAPYLIYGVLAAITVAWLVVAHVRDAPAAYLPLAHADARGKRAAAQRRAAVVAIAKAVAVDAGICALAFTVAELWIGRSIYSTPV